ncbi:hypothetical protein CASFOL_031367 [Castilleja foliolosa]|uniref:Uncharacterized protein n=1 Tax=Castilleja foliolosa TaxID=1961234 RepID=A0ABD3C5W8_9LAMI
MCPGYRLGQMMMGLIEGTGLVRGVALVNWASGGILWAAGMVYLDGLIAVSSWVGGPEQVARIVRERSVSEGLGLIFREGEGRLIEDHMTGYNYCSFDFVGKTKDEICSSLNYEKLSLETFNDLIENANFPTKSATQALVSRQRKLNRLIQETDIASRLSLSSETAIKGTRKFEGSREIVQKLNHSDENENLRAHLKGMQYRVLELENVCQKMQFRMAKITKPRFSSHNNATSLPKLCS